MQTNTLPHFSLVNLLKRFIHQLFRGLDLFFQVCTIPKNRRLCYSSMPDYSDNAYYLYQHALRTRDNLEHIWLLRDMTPVARHRDMGELARRIEKDFYEVTKASGRTGNRLRIVHRRSFTGYWLYLTSRHVFHTHGIYRYPRHSIRRNIVSLWHGMVFKRVGKLRPSAIPFYAFGTVHIATSHLFKYIVANAFDAEPDQVLVCNYPRNDALSHSEARRCSAQDIRKQLGLPESEKLLLWLPTFHTEPFNPSPADRLRPRSFVDNIEKQALDALEQAAQTHNTTILIKLHPYDHANKLDMEELNYPKFRLIRSAQWDAMQIPLYDLAAASDALLTDVSSIMFDYLITRRPIGIVGINLDTYERGTSFPVSYLFNSGCFEQLTDAASIDRFMASLDLQEDHETHSRGNREIFMENFDESGSEHILRHLGL